MAENKILDDLAKFGTSTLTAMTGAQRQVRKWAGEQVESLIQSMELVNKKDLEVLSDRINELEAKLAAFENAKPATPKTPNVESAAKPVAKAKKPATAKKSS